MSKQRNNHFTCLSLALACLVYGCRQETPQDSSVVADAIPVRNPTSPSYFVPLAQRGFNGVPDAGLQQQLSGQVIQGGNTQNGQFGVDQFTVRIPANQVPADFDGAAFMQNLRDNPNSVYSPKTQALLGWQQAPAGGTNALGSQMNLQTFAGAQPVVLVGDKEDKYSYGVLTLPGHVEAGTRQWALSKDPVNGDVLFTNTGASVAAHPLPPIGQAVITSGAGEFGPIINTGVDQTQKAVLAPAVQQEVWTSQQADVAAALERTMGLSPGTAQTSGYQKMLPTSLMGMNDVQIGNEILKNVDVNAAAHQVNDSISDRTVENVVRPLSATGFTVVNGVLSSTGREPISPVVTSLLTDAAVNVAQNGKETAINGLITAKNSASNWLSGKIVGAGVWIAGCYMKLYLDGEGQNCAPDGAVQSPEPGASAEPGTNPETGATSSPEPESIAAEAADASNPANKTDTASEDSAAINGSAGAKSLGNGESDGVAPASVAAAEESLYANGNASLAKETTTPELNSEASAATENPSANGEASTNTNGEAGGGSPVSEEPSPVPPPPAMPEE